MLWDARDAGAAAEADWTQRFRPPIAQAYPEEAAEFERRARGALPARWREAVARAGSDANREARIDRDAQGLADRDRRTCSARCRSCSAARRILRGSNLTSWKDAVDRAARRRVVCKANYIHYGVREFGMSAMHERHCVASADTCRSAARSSPSPTTRATRLRMAALMKTAHDLRLHARFDRPWRRRSDASVGRTCGNAAPDSGARRLASVRYGRDRVSVGIRRRSGSSFLPVAVSRQNLPFVTRSDRQIEAIERGGYVLRDWPDASGPHDRCVVLIATGSEVELALGAMKQLARRRHRRARRIDAFDHGLRPPVARMARQRCCRPACRASRSKRASVRSGGNTCGLEGGVVGIDSFGESAPARRAVRAFRI